MGCGADIFVIFFLL